jgi:hypothetical protein
LTVRDDEPRLPSGHSLILALSDELGVVVLCSCEEWGCAGPDMEHAHQAFEAHVTEATGNGDSE